jgi:hypothetical protein
MIPISFVLDTWFIVAISGIESNQNPEKAKNILKVLRRLNELKRLKHVYILWPVYYESLNTRFLETTNAVNRLNKFLREFGSKIVVVDDSTFRGSCLKEIIEEENGIALSLTDRVIGKFLLSSAIENPKEIFVLITADEDFGSFVCFWRKHRISNVRVVRSCKELREFL